jgi:hypothetical protein
VEAVGGGAVLFADGQLEGHLRPAGWDRVEEAIGQFRRTRKVEFLARAVRVEHDP